MGYLGGWRRLQEAKDSNHVLSTLLNFPEDSIMAGKLGPARAVGMNCENYTHKGNMFQKLCNREGPGGSPLPLYTGNDNRLQWGVQVSLQMLQQWKGVHSRQCTHALAQAEAVHTNSCAHMCVRTHSFIWPLYSTFIALACMPSTRSKELETKLVFSNIHTIWLWK